jgi:hypothetical protein
VSEESHHRCHRKNRSLVDLMKVGRNQRGRTLLATIDQMFGRCHKQRDPVVLTGSDKHMAQVSKTCGATVLSATQDPLKQR